MWEQRDISLGRQSYQPGLLAKGGSGDPAGMVGEDPCQDVEVLDKKPDIICRSCGNGIASSEHRIELFGTHHHTFANPAGIVYQVGCFSSAPGCVALGRLTLEFTWFPGYAWCFALCAACRTHLGWHYRSETREAFFGLIMNRLVESELGQ